MFRDWYKKMHWICVSGFHQRWRTIPSDVEIGLTVRFAVFTVMRAGGDTYIRQLLLPEVGLHDYRSARWGVKTGTWAWMRMNWDPKLKMKPIQTNHGLCLSHYLQLWCLGQHPGKAHTSQCTGVESSCPWCYSQGIGWKEQGGIQSRRKLLFWRCLKSRKDGLIVTVGMYSLRLESGVGGPSLEQSRASGWPPDCCVWVGWGKVRIWGKIPFNILLPKYSPLGLFGKNVS